MAMDFPVSPVDRLPIFPDEAASAAALMELIGGAGRGEEESANGSRGAVLGGFGRSSTGQFVGAAMCGEETSVAASGAAMSGFSESEGDIADAIDQGGVEAHLDGDQDAVMQDRTESGDGGSAQSTGKVDPQAPGWTKRVRVGNHHRTGRHVPTDHVDQLAVIQGWTDSGDAASGQSTGKVDPQAPGWTKRIGRAREEEKSRATDN